MRMDPIPCDPAVTDCAVEAGALLRFGASDASGVAAPSAKVEKAEAEASAEPVEAPADGAAPDATQTVADADPAGVSAGDLGALAQGVDNPGLTVVLAILAVAGSAAGWKFFSQFSEQRHEQAMRKLDIEAQASGIGRAQPQACAVKHAELESRVADLSARLDDVIARADAIAKKTASFDADTDVSDIERQVKRLSKAVKALQTSPD
jgi:hypothetical protein